MNMLANSFVGMKGMQICTFSNFSFTKCWLISTCFVLSCCIGLWAMFIAILLSQYNLIRVSIHIFNSSRSFFSQRSSHIPCAIALNSTSALLLATITYFSQSQGFPKQKCKNLRLIACHLWNPCSLSVHEGFY